MKTDRDGFLSFFLRKETMGSRFQISRGNHVVCIGGAECSQCKFLFGGMKQASCLTAVAEVRALAAAQLPKEFMADLCSFSGEKEAFLARK